MTARVKYSAELRDWDPTGIMALDGMRSVGDVAAARCRCGGRLHTSMARWPDDARYQAGCNGCGATSGWHDSMYAAWRALDKAWPK